MKTIATLCLSFIVPPCISAQVVDTIMPGSARAAALNISWVSDSVVNFSNDATVPSAFILRGTHWTSVGEEAGLEHVSLWKHASNGTYSEETMVLRMPDLMPVFARTRANTDSAFLEWKDGHMVGYAAPGKGERNAWDLPLDDPHFIGGIDLLMNALPLAAGYVAVLPTVNRWTGTTEWTRIAVTGSEKLERGGRSWDCWVVEPTPGGTVKKYWISKELRTPLRMEGHVAKAPAHWVDEHHPYYNNSEVAVSRDGKHIAFSSSRSGRDRIHVADSDGSNERVLTSDTMDHHAPTWSPDGKQLACMRGGENGARLCVMEVATGRTRELPVELPGLQSPNWSPVDDRIAFAAGAWPQLDIHTIHADGSGLVRVAELDGPEFWPVWSPDAQRFALTAFRPGESGVYTMRADGTDLKLLARKGETPAWSPDGRTVVVQMPAEEGYGIVAVLVSDGTQRTLTPGLNAEVPAWSTDDHIFFQRRQHGALDLYRVNVDGSGLEKVLVGGNWW
ncbi:MAG: LpqB family beta-propeller domain-containing protein [Flavobacteriales bacterium]